MPLLLLFKTYWKPIAIILAIVAVFYAGYHVRGAFDQIAADKALAAQEEKLTKVCESDKQTTKEAQDALQKQYTIIADKLAATKRMRPAACIIPQHPDSSNVASIGGKYAGQNGISSDWLRDYAAECETYRQQRISLEAFIDAVEIKRE